MRTTQRPAFLPGPTQVFNPQTQTQMSKTQMLLAGNSGVQSVKLAPPTPPIFVPETITQKMMKETQLEKMEVQSLFKPQSSPESGIASDDKLYEPLPSSQSSIITSDEQEEPEEEIQINRSMSTSRPWKPPRVTSATRKSSKTRTARPWRPFFVDE